MVDLGDVLLPIPDEGGSVSLELLYPAGAETFTVSASLDNVLDYQHEAASVDEADDGYKSEPVLETSGGHDAPGVTPDDGTGVSPRPGRTEPDWWACDRIHYLTKSEKWYGTWTFWMGDGIQPAGGTQADYAAASKAAAAAIVTQDNPCDLPDEVNATWTYGGATSLEGDFVTSGGSTGCAAESEIDSKSTIDVGNLDGNGNPPVAGTCTWTDAHDGPDAVKQADVRINTTDYDFTYTPGASNCSKRIDVQSILTHEFGHVYGLKDLYSGGDEYLTMFFRSVYCKAYPRSLGRGDVLGYRNLY